MGMLNDSLEKYDQVRRHVREAALLGSIASVLEWDERTYLPPRACEYRAEQVSHLAGLVHDAWNEPRFGDLLNTLNQECRAIDPESDEAVTLRELTREQRKKAKLPKTLVEELAKLSVLGQHTWIDARKHNRFAILQPALEQLLRLKREEADALGFEHTPYDALLDEYEPGESTANIAQIFAALRQELIPLVRGIASSGRQPDISVLFRSYPLEAQERFSMAVTRQIGFDFDRGRLDTTAHPFCTHLGPNDVRLTTRYDQHDFNQAFFGTLHEAGHGLYEQGLAKEHFGLPLGESVSLGIHESQSRFWENLIARSAPFWRHYYAQAQASFPTALSDVHRDDFYFAINDVRPSLVRVEADEVTYNMHIFIRFELEQALLSGDLAVADLPIAWIEKYREYLDIEPTDDNSGVLQDIHWSGGAIGYFPTYALGNLYAAQFFEQVTDEIDSLDDQMRQGDFAALLGWLRDNIHHHGRRYRASELVQRVTHRPLSHEPLLRHLMRKYKPLYGL